VIGGLEDCYIISAFGDVCSDGVSVFLEVGGGVVGGSLLEH